MCTVVIEVPEVSGGSIRLLAVRDEDPNRPWDPPGYWWPERLPGIIGVHDRRAGGAWLAADPAARRLAVLLNRVPADRAVEPAGGFATRGTLALDSASGAALPEQPTTAAFSLVSVARPSQTDTQARPDSDFEAVVTSWDGITLNRQILTPGVHMLAHHDVDDVERTPRIAAWLPAFQELQGAQGDWRAQWINVLADTAQLPATDDRAILRDNRIHGYPTQSLLACITEIGPAGMQLDTAVFADPASDAHAVALSFERSISERS